MDVLRREYRKIEWYYSDLGKSILLDFFEEGGICDTQNSSRGALISTVSPEGFHDSRFLDLF